MCTFIPSKTRRLQQGNSDIFGASVGKVGNLGKKSSKEFLEP